jgi:cell division protein FtsZ
MPTAGSAAGMVSATIPVPGKRQPDYAGTEIPAYVRQGPRSVWHTNRTMAAAKVDALSSGGMDDLEIPAFLRKQAD